MKAAAIRTELASVYDLSPRIFEQPDDAIREVATKRYPGGRLIHFEYFSVYLVKRRPG